MMPFRSISMSSARRLTGFSTLVFALCWATAPLASGGYGGGGGGGYGGRIDQPRAERSDPRYDRGKSIFSGRSQDAKGVRFCVVTISEEDSERTATRISLRSLRPFKKGEAVSLMASLVNCEDVSSPATELLSSREMRSLVYYLDKRFRLRLKS